MSNTIREEQMESVVHPSGHWVISNEDLQTVLNDAYPGLIGEVHDEYLAIWKPIS